MMNGHTNIKNSAMESITPKRQELVLKKRPQVFDVADTWLHC
jgi:hypothetical protein